MPYHDDNDAADLDPAEFPEPDWDTNDDVETVPCPYCRRPIYEEAERCPHCENYLSCEDAPTHRPWWLVIGAVFCLGVALTWAAGC
jgi:hypothetical protein